VSSAEIVRIELGSDEAVVLARQRARDVAELAGFEHLDATRIATAVSELARNAHRYARDGRVRLLLNNESLAIEVVDQGPGNLDEVLEGRYVSATGMGRGLVGVRLLMDEFSITAHPGRGTHVKVSKRLPVGMLRPDPLAIRRELLRRGAASPYDEVRHQNEELLQALGEVRARQQELLALNHELADTNRGVVALYAELDDTADQLRDADDRKSRFLADMSHELRTPLNSIVALTELLLDGPPLAEEQSKQVLFIRRTAEEQLRLVGDLLDIAKIEAGKLAIASTDVSVPELFTTLRAQLRPLVTGGAVSLHFSASADLPLVHTDEDKLIQILRNLISNALKFTAAGDVTVLAEGTEQSITFHVADTGIGIAEADLGRIFDEFVQIPGEHQRRGRGTGLGLPLSRKLTMALGGTLDVSSKVGTGTTFSLRLPLRADAPLPAPAPFEDLSGAVLVIDDDETARYVLTAHLSPTAWAVQTAGGGIEGLEAIAHSRPAAVILDLSMPDLDGINVLERLRAGQETRDLPVLIHTSRMLSANERERIRELNADVMDKATASRAALLAWLSASVEVLRP
jgi:signal transduction histidine kinase/CheY-like chemotaxis protein